MEVGSRSSPREAAAGGVMGGFDPPPERAIIHFFSVCRTAARTVPVYAHRIDPRTSSRWHFLASGVIFSPPHFLDP
jgi:hypothetical protein